MFDQARAIDEIASGKTLREVGAIVGCDASYICKTAAREPEFGQQYAHAMAIRAEADVAELPELRRRMLAGEITPEQARVAADLIKWPASKRLPKVYGDRIQSEVDMTIRVQVEDPTLRAVITAQQSLPNKDE